MGFPAARVTISTFYQSLTLQDTSPAAATLYLLSEKPQLTGHGNFRAL